MGMSERSFWRSPLKKILKMIDIFHDEAALKHANLNQEEYASKYFNRADKEAKEIHSMRELEGFVDGC